MNYFNVRVETNWHKPNGSLFSIDNHEHLSLDETVRILNGEGFSISSDEIAPLTVYDFRRWEGAGCFKQIHLSKLA